VVSFTPPTNSTPMPIKEEGVLTPKTVRMILRREHLLPCQESNPCLLTSIKLMSNISVHDHQTLANLKNPKDESILGCNTVVMGEWILKFQWKTLSSCSRVLQFTEVQEDSSWTLISKDDNTMFF
jgi:hypothetical protein